MKKNCSSVQLLTVGSGTAGRHSNVAEGIIAALLHDRPDVAYLAPSGAPESRAVAEIVRDGCRERDCDCVRPTPAGDAFFAFTDPDDIECCRSEAVAMLTAIGAAHPGARIVLNPTSGTKQMTAAAVLAALDAGLPELRFITGIRRDGVVATGTERVSVFSTRSFMAQRARRLVADLIRGGAYDQAVTVAADYLPELDLLHRQARLYAAWDRCSYHDALKIAREAVGAPWEAAARHLSILVADGPCSLPRAADLLSASRRALALGRPEEALVRAYRLIELAAKFRLNEHDIREPYNLDDLLARLPPSEHDALRRNARNGRVALGMSQAIHMLRALRDPLGRDILNADAVRDIMEMRNEGIYGHGTKSAGAEKVARRIERVSELLGFHLPGLRKLASSFAFDEPLEN